MDSDPVPPSSPPHATTNAPDSPFFEPRSNAFLLKSSSPPPLFSSDDSRESADLGNYQSPRIFKNKRKGAWWDSADSAHSTPEVKKTKMTRNYDSGVYMMSDYTDSSESLALPHKAPFGSDDANDIPDDILPPEEFPQTSKPTWETMFSYILDRGLDQNRQTYDFSNIDLEDAALGRIGELASVIKDVPDPGNDLPVEGQYRSMVPELHVDLGYNKLRRLTPSLFEVQNLTTLTLRWNRIEELPSQMGQLRRLRELNLSGNPLAWLPIEMLDLFRGDHDGRLSIFGDSGVPWLQPRSQHTLWTSEGRQIEKRIAEEHKTRSSHDSIWDASPGLPLVYELVAASPDRERLAWVMRQFELDRDETMRLTSYDGSLAPRSDSELPKHLLAPRYLARTLVGYFDETGGLIDGSPPPISRKDDDFTVITDTNRGAHGVPATWFTPPHTKKTRSLLTMSLHKALRYMSQEGLTISDLRSHIGDPMPPAVDAILKQAEANSDGGYGGLKQCHMCKEDYVVARAEWIEWWLPKDSSQLPFRVQVCSWACVPDAIMKRPQKLLAWD
jgi:hypothetical protein